MDQSQVKALAALQPFVHLATTTKSPTHRFVADLITRATSAPDTFVFTELVQTAAVQSLRAADTPPEYQAYLTLSELFSWGTYEEYISTPNLPELSPAQTLKLRQLSLLTLASPFGPTVSPDVLTYPSLIAALGLPNPAALESLITTSIYAGLLTARLSPTSNPPVVHITSVAPLRDLRPQSLPALLQILQTWESRCTDVAASLEAQIQGVRTSAAARSAQQKKRQEMIDTAVLSDKSSLNPSNTAVASSSPQLDSNENTDTERKLRGGPKGGNRSGNKRDLDEQLEGEIGDVSDDDGRMDVDEGISPEVKTTGIGGRGGAAVARGAKRNRGRG